MIHKLAFSVLLAGLTSLVVMISATPSRASSEPETTTSSAPVLEKSKEELEIEAQTLVFRDSLVAMQDEIVAAYPDNIEAIVQPRRDEARALAALIGVFLEARRETITSPTERSEAEDADAKALLQIQRLPDFIRSVVTRGLAEALARAENPPAVEGDAATLPPVSPGTPDGMPD